MKPMTFEKALKIFRAWYRDKLKLLETFEFESAKPLTGFFAQDAEACWKEGYNASLAQLEPQLKAKDAEIARLREGLMHVIGNHSKNVNGTPCLCYVCKRGRELIGSQ